MKKLSYIFVLAALAAVGIFACKKSSFQGHKPHDTLNSVQSSKEATQSRLYVNPFDYIGNIHNTVLIKALQDDHYPALTNSAKVIYVTKDVNRELSALGLTTLPESHIVDVLHFDRELPDFTLQTTETYYAQLYTVYPASEQVILEDLHDMLNTYGASGNRAQLMADKETLEAKVNASVPDNRRDIFLAGISLGTSSVTYWSSGSAEPAVMKPWLADVKGFFGGAHLQYTMNGGSYEGVIDAGLTCGAVASVCVKVANSR